MVYKISATLHRIASGRLILLLLAGIFLVFFTLFANRSTRGESVPGPIDILFFYTPDEVYAMVDAYGPVVRADYIRFELTADILYPVLYTLFMCLAISLLFQRGFKAESRWQLLNLVPLGAGFFDVLENLSIVGMLALHPSRPAELAWAATSFTMLKWSIAAAALGLILVGGVASCIRLIKR